MTLGELPEEPGEYVYTVNIPTNAWNIMSDMDEPYLLPAPMTLTYNLTVTAPKIVTFTVAGEENYTNLEYAALTLEEFMGDASDLTLQPMTSDSFEVKLGAGEGPTNVVILKPAEGYTMTITCDVPEYAGEGAYTWQNMSVMMGDVEATTQVMLGIGAGAEGAEFTITLTEEQPQIDALVFEDWTMKLPKNGSVTAEVPVSLVVETPFDYQGFQFDIALPEGLEVTAAALAEDGSVTFETKEYDGVPNTTRFVAKLEEGTRATNDILTLTVSATYGEIDPGEYDVVISNASVIFATPTGSDIFDINGWEGTVTIELAEIPAESITIESVTLNEPSFTDEDSDMVEQVVAGESVDMTITVLPEDTTDETTVTADNEGVTITDNGDGTWTVDTSGVVVPEGEESVDVKITVKAGDVEEEYTLTVKAVLLGDSNDNGVVTVADVVTTANYIAEKEIDNFCFPNANVILTPNEEGEQVINAQDLTATINIVLKIWDNERNPQNARRHANRYASNDRLVASNFKAGQSTIAVDLESTAAYAALQATIELPAGMKVDHVAVGQRAANHELVYNVTGNELHVVLFSYDNSSFTNEGSLFNIAVVADENCGDLQMKNILASDAASNGYELSFEGGLYSEATGIEGIDADAEGVRYFTVDGIEVFNPEAGQILIRVANGSAEKVIIK